jgi:hypothetical protein
MHEKFKAPVGPVHACITYVLARSLRHRQRTSGKWVGSGRRDPGLCASCDGGGQRHASGAGVVERTQIPHVETGGFFPTLVSSFLPPSVQEPTLFLQEETVPTDFSLFPR